VRVAGKEALWLGADVLERPPHQTVVLAAGDALYDERLGHDGRYPLRGFSVLVGSWKII